MSSESNSPFKVGSTSDRQGILSHQVRSPFQGEQTTIHVKLPENFKQSQSYRSLYFLPVERLDGRAWGDALGEVKRCTVPADTIVIVPTFSAPPWYADHPTDDTIRQESYFLKNVLPFVEEHYPVEPASSHRLLLGFSKSGWGAYSLLLRHPELFGKAAAWDAPLGQTLPTKYGMNAVFANQAVFDRYFIWDLLKRRRDQLGDLPRLGLFGYGDFRGHHQATHFHMKKYGVAHHYVDGPRRKHHWESGWVSEAIDFLLRD